jgi:hypothetical protein
MIWLVRGFASICRTVFDATGALALLYSGPRTPTTLARQMSLRFDLALQDPSLIRDHLRHRGCQSSLSLLPRIWLEGSTHEYLVRGRPLPPCRSPRQKLTILAEEQQVRVPAATGSVRAAIEKKWSASLNALVAIDEPAVADVISRAEDEHGYFASHLVAVHEQPARESRPRPPVEESWRRHANLIAQLAPLAESSHLPIVWHALWRLPSSMTWTDEGGSRWMRYPAVSLVVGARRIGNRAD